MNLITPDGGLLFWMVVIFAIVFFLLAKFGFPIITSAVEKRSERIADSLVRADEVERRVAEMDAERGKMLEETRREQAKMLKEASDTRDLILEKAKADAAEETARMIEHARMQIEADRRSAEADMRRQIAMLSVDVAEKVLRKTLASSSEQSALIDRLVDEAAKTAEKPQS
ncbi:MAG: F0F1 ATP synthase subunit B [Bacteroidales bacterium]|nr:F0F1 ATP synthase subunit B [Bacteroidales bacterium]